MSNSQDQVMENESPDECMSAVELQQRYFDNMSDCDWVRYELHNRTHLKQNIAFAMFGPPSVEGDFDTNSRNDGVELQGYETKQIDNVTKVFDTLCKQGKYSLNDSDIYLYVLLIACCKPRPLRFYELKPTLYWCDLHSKKDIILWGTPLFSVRKCIPPMSGGKGCRLYVDEEGRVYHSWQSYLEQNTLPECVLVVPTNGEYIGTRGEDGTVSVDISVVASPALGPTAKILEMADTTTTIASVGSLAVFGVAMVTPVAPVLLAGAGVATVVTGVYGLVRSSLHLHDRRTHEQTLSPVDPEARGSWINIGASSVGLAAGASSRLLSKSAAAGTNMTKTGVFLQRSVNFLRHASLVTGGAGVINSLVHFVVKYQKHGETPSTLELFQFTASTLFLFNAVMDNRTAQSIIEEAQTKTINEYRDNLRSNRHRKIFDKASAETRRLGGFVEGNTEVIRGIKNIANKDQFFADILRINKNTDPDKLRISLTADGKVNLNAKHTFHPDQLAGLGKEARANLFSSLGEPDLTVRNVPTRLTASSSAARVASERRGESSSMLNIRPGEVIGIGSMMVRLTTYSVEQIAAMLHDLSKDVANALITLTSNLIKRIVPEDIRRLNILNPDEDILVQILDYVFNFLKQNIPIDAPDDDTGIKAVLSQFFSEGHVRQDTLICLINRLHQYINNKFENAMRSYPNKQEMICDICRGTKYL